MIVEEGHGEAEFMGERGKLGACASPASDSIYSINRYGYLQSTRSNSTLRGSTRGSRNCATGGRGEGSGGKAPSPRNST